MPHFNPCAKPPAGTIHPPPLIKGGLGGIFVLADSASPQIPRLLREPPPFIKGGYQCHTSTPAPNHSPARSIPPLIKGGLGGDFSHSQNLPARKSPRLLRKPPPFVKGGYQCH